MLNRKILCKAGRKQSVKSFALDGNERRRVMQPAVVDYALKIKK